MTTQNDSHIPSALHDVWKWKDEVARETVRMTTAEMLAYIHHTTDKIRTKAGLVVAAPVREVARVAETKTNHGSG